MLSNSIYDCTILVCICIHPSSLLSDDKISSIHYFDKLLNPIKILCWLSCISTFQCVITIENHRHTFCMWKWKHCIWNSILNIENDFFWGELHYVDLNEIHFSWIKNIYFFPLILPHQNDYECSYRGQFAFFLFNFIQPYQIVAAVTASCFTYRFFSHPLCCVSANIAMCVCFWWLFCNFPLYTLPTLIIFTHNLTFC